MFRLLRAALLGVAIFVVVFWGIIPFMMGYDLGQKQLSERQAFIEAEKLLATNGLDPNQIAQIRKTTITNRVRIATRKFGITNSSA